MSRFGKKFKRYERYVLLGMVIVLVAVFSVVSAMQGCQRGGVHPGNEDFSGSFESQPGVRHSVSDAEFRGYASRYNAFATFPGLAPTLRWLPEFHGVQADSRLPARLATWAHIATVTAAREAGYAVSDDELSSGVESFVQAAAGSRPGAPGLSHLTPQFYELVLDRVYQRGSRSDFERTVREILLKDKYLRPLVDGARFVRTRSEGYEAWKAEHERVDLRFAAIPADQFLDDVRLVEATRATISTVADPLGKLLEAANRVRQIRSVVLEHKTRHGELPKDQADLYAKPPGSTSVPNEQRADPWKTEIAYEATVGPDGAPDFRVRSAGPDQQPGSPDDVDLGAVDVLQTMSALWRTAGALRDWEAVTASWPASLELLTTDPTPAEGRKPGSKPLQTVPKDAWGRDFTYSATGPRVASLGPDGVAGTEDDVEASVVDGAVRVPVPERFAAYLPAGGAKDAWGAPLRVLLRGDMPLRFGVTSDGPDGKAGTSDDVSDGNAGDLDRYFGEVRSEHRVEAKRAFEYLYTIFALVPDDALQAAWADLAPFRPTEEAAFDRFRGNLGEGDERAVYYRIAEGRPPNRVEIDPADPTKGYSASVLADLRKQGALPEGAPTWQVPSATAFGEQGADPKPEGGRPANPEDAIWKTYLAKGWRRVLLREMFFENLFANALQRLRDSQNAVKEWEEKKNREGERPAETTFDTILAEYQKYTPGVAETDQGAMFLKKGATDGPVSRTEYEKIPVIDQGISGLLPGLAEGEYLGPTPRPVLLSTARLLLRNVKSLPERDATLAEVRDKVYPRYLLRRALVRAKEEGERIREAAMKPDAKLEDVVATVAAERKFRYVIGTTGLFEGNQPPSSVELPEGASDEDRLARRRREIVRQRGYYTVKATGSLQATATTFGRFILLDEPSGSTPATDSAYFVEVLSRDYPPPEAFTWKEYAHWLQGALYDEAASLRGGRARLADRTGSVTRRIASLYEVWDGIRDFWRIETASRIEIPRERE